MSDSKITVMFKKLSFGNGNMIAIGDNSFSFRIIDVRSNIPKDVHFTFGYNKETGDINLHVTRNVQDQNNKPHVKVAICHKDALNEALPKLGAKLIKLHLMPLAWFNRKKKTKYREYQERRFLYMSAVEKWSDYREGEFLPQAAKHFKKKGGKGKYEMQPTFEPGMEQWSKTKFRMKALRAAIKPLHDMDLTQPVWGLLLSKEYRGPALIVDREIYIFRAAVEPLEFFAALLGKTTALQLIQKVKDAIRIVEHAESYDDIKKAGEAIRLFSRYNNDKNHADVN